MRELYGNTDRESYVKPELPGAQVAEFSGKPKLLGTQVAEFPENEVERERPALELP